MATAGPVCERRLLAAILWSAGTDMERDADGVARVVPQDLTGRALAKGDDHKPMTLTRQTVPVVFAGKPSTESKV
jgi:hypothetical protein